MISRKRVTARQVQRVDEQAQIQHKGASILGKRV
jgi:hypothetical protein